MTKIIEPPIENSKNETTVMITVDVPLSLSLYGRREDSEYERIAIEYLREIAGDVSAHIAYLGGLEAHTANMPEYRIFEILGDFGKNLMEAIEYIEMDFKRGDIDYWPRRNAEQSTEPDADLSAYRQARDLCQKLSADKKDSAQLSELVLAVLNHPDIPSRFFNTLYNAINLMSDSDLTVPFDEEDISKALLVEQCRGIEPVRADAPKSDAAELARHISAVMNHPLTPAKLYNAITDELGDLCGPVLDEFINMPETIEKAINYLETKSATKQIFERKKAA